MLSTTSAAPSRFCSKEGHTLSFSAFSSFSHLLLDFTSCLLVNFKLKIWSRSLSPPIRGSCRKVLSRTAHKYGKPI